MSWLAAAEEPDTAVEVKAVCGLLFHTNHGITNCSLHYLSNLPRHPDGSSSIHGHGPSCALCFPLSHRPTIHNICGMSSYIRVQHGDGETDFYNPPKTLRYLKTWSHDVLKMKDEENAKRKIFDTADMVSKMVKNGELIYVSGWTVPDDGLRSADEIRSEIAVVIADRNQLHLNGAGEALQMATCNKAEVMLDQLAMCSGALQDENKGKEEKKEVKKTPVKSILTGTAQMEVNFQETVEWRPVSRVEEI